MYKTFRDKQDGCIKVVLQAVRRAWTASASEDRRSDRRWPAGSAGSASGSASPKWLAPRALARSWACKGSER